MTLPGFYNFDDTTNRIRKIVEVLDGHWFLDSKKKFKEKCKDGDHYIEVDNTPDNWGTLSDEEKFYSGDPIKVIDFREFCYWDYYDVQKKLTNEIQKIISNTNPDAEGVKNIIKFVAVVVSETIKESIGEFRSKPPSQLEYGELIRSLSKHFNWSMDLHFNDKIKDLELYQAIRSGNTIILPRNKVTFNSDYETDSLTKIFLPDAVAAYIEIEKRLLEDKYLDKRCKWIKSRTLEECAGLINKLLIKGYIRLKKNGHDKWITKTCKPFFEDRYGIKFTKQMQRAYRISNKLSPFFDWIEFLH